MIGEVDRAWSLHKQNYHRILVKWQSLAYCSSLENYRLIVIWGPGFKSQFHLQFRILAQFGRAHRLGRCGQTFESFISDQFCMNINILVTLQLLRIFMHFYTYKITNLLNGKIYIGVHKTENLEDNYMGSGKVLNRAKDKHGIENFHKEILKFHKTQEEMFAHEAELVTRDFIARNDVYNIKLGGEGGWDFVNRVRTTEELKNIQRKGGRSYAKRITTDTEFREKVLSKHRKLRSTPEFKAKISITLKAVWAENGHPWTGKTHSEESKAKARETFAMINHQQGEKNSMYGKMWIHSLEERKSTCINNNEPIPTGWMKGRKMFKN